MPLKATSSLIVCPQDIAPPPISMASQIANITVAFSKHFLLCDPIFEQTPKIEHPLMHTAAFTRSAHSVPGLTPGTAKKAELGLP